MTLFLINYDLVRDDFQRPALAYALAEIGARRVLSTTWIARLEGWSAEQVADHLTRSLEQCDGLFVAPFTRWAGRNVANNVEDL